MENKIFLKSLLLIFVFIIIDISLLFGNFAFLFTNHNLLDYKAIFNIIDLLFIAFNTIIFFIKVGLIKRYALMNFKKSSLIVLLSFISQILFFIIIGVDVHEVLILMSLIILISSLLYKNIYGKNTLLLLSFIPSLLLTILFIFSALGSVLDILVLLFFIFQIALYVYLFITKISVNLNGYTIINLVALLVIISFVFIGK